MEHASRKSDSLPFMRLQKGSSLFNKLSGSFLCRLSLFHTLGILAKRGYIDAS